MPAVLVQLNEKSYRFTLSPVADRYNGGLTHLIKTNIMNDPIDYTNNPLHGLSLKNLLLEIVEHYGFEILFAYLNINCFKTNPRIASSLKFLKKTTWAREKVEAFYLYEFKNLPKVSSKEFSIPPRDRLVPANQTPGKPAELSLEDAEQLQTKRVNKASTYNKGQHTTHENKRPPVEDSYSPENTEDPWAKWR